MKSVSDQLGDIITVWASEALSLATRRLEVDLRRAASVHRDTGAMEAAIVVEQTSQLEVDVRINVPYASYSNTGTTGPYDIYPKTAKALRWFSQSTGQPIFAQHVVHPGIKGDHWYDNAIKEWQEQTLPDSLDRTIV